MTCKLTRVVWSRDCRTDVQSWLNYAFWRETCKQWIGIFVLQAEDGIRDVAVTGVQTCALPIYSNRSADMMPGLRTRAARDRARTTPRGPNKASRSRYIRQPTSETSLTVAGRSRCHKT